MSRMDSAFARFAVWKWGGDQSRFMPWPRAESAPMDGDQLLNMVKRMKLPQAKRKS